MVGDTAGDGARSSVGDGMTHADLLREIVIAASKRGHRLFVVNTGVGWMGEVLRRSADTITIRNPRPIRAGLVRGGSDLIGWTSSGRFAALEGKVGRDKTSDEQARFIAAVIQAGGVAGVVRSVDDAMGVLG